MSKLVRPREHQERKQSLARDSEAKKAEARVMLARLVTNPEYAYLKGLAATIANQYRGVPGNTVEENTSYLTHCTILWAFNIMWKTIEDIAKVPPKEKKPDANDGW